MLKLDSDPQVANKQMHGLIYYLTALGYIDGDLDSTETNWVLETIGRLVDQRLDAKELGDDAELRAQLKESMVAECEEVFDSSREEVLRLLEESVSQGEGQEAYVASRLKQRCFEIFEGFDPEQQAELIKTADDILLIDGTVHPAEVRFRDELSELLRAPAEVLLLPDALKRTTEITEHDTWPSEPFSHPIFDEVEQHYARDEAERSQQIAADRELMREVLDVLEAKRSEGASRLSGLPSMDDVAAGTEFLDEFVYVVQPEQEERCDLTVLGDLHGCYSAMKAAIVQSRFLEKMEAYEAAPTEEPKPKLVLLGDYLDRGNLSYEGTLRLAMRLFVTYPDNVHILRGNHEFHVEHEGDVVSTVSPAEALARLRPWVELDYFRDTVKLFNSLPCLLVFGRILFVHGGIPIDSVTRDNVKDLSGLNAWPVIFQMLWSDPSPVDVMPKKLQESSYRFGFGRLQALSFLQRVGCHTLIRGHEHLPTGFRREYDDEQLLALTVFSGGGAGNDDLPEHADLRLTNPKALSVRSSGDRDAPVTIDVWPVDYKKYNAPENNAFYAKKPGLPFE